MMKLRELLDILSRVQKDTQASTPFIVGGTPRDRYLGALSQIADIDISTGDASVFSLASDFCAELQKTINATIKQSSDGHQTIFIGSFKLDFSSHFIVPGIDDLLKEKGIQNPTEMQREVFSRDFTCNSLLLSLDLKTISDPTNQGLKDIDAKMIKTCLAPEITLTSNKNRVIRAIYLAAKLGFEIDQPIINYVASHPDVVRISTEKVMAEKINQAFEYDAEKTTKYLTEMKLWNEIPITERVYPHYQKHLKTEIANG